MNIIFKSALGVISWPVGKIFSGIMAGLIKLINPDRVIDWILKASIAYFSKWLLQNGLSKIEKLIIQAVDILNRTLGKEFVHDNKYKTDDKIVEYLEDMARRLAKENDFELHTVGKLRT